MESIRSARLQVRCACGVAALLLLPIIARSQSHAFTLSPIVTRGEPAPGGGRFFESGGEGFLSGDHALNDKGEVVISAIGVPGGFSGMYLVSGSNRVRIIDFAHGFGGARLGFLGQASINNLGQVALNAGPTINNTIVDMLLLYSDGQLTKIAAEGDTSPTGTIFGRCGFSPPGINDNGDVSFFACANIDPARFGNGVFIYSSGQISKVVEGADPSPVGGTLSTNLQPPPVTWNNNRGDVLFEAGQLDPDITVPERFGLFLATTGMSKKIELSKDIMPNGSTIASNSIGLGSLNNLSDVAFSLLLSGEPDSGVFLNTGAQTKTIVLAGDPTPIGGTFRSLLDPTDPEGFPRPALNDNGAVAIQLRLKGGSSPEAIFLASPTAMLKVVGVGDRLPTGEKIREIFTFSLNNLGQVAFFAYGQTGENMPLGVYLATPVSPAISSVKVKSKSAGPQLIINGQGFITNDSIIQINGQPVKTEYPADFQENGGTTTRLISRDPQLPQLLPVGQSIQVTVISPLTARQSETFTISR
jgi:hypothetical protein